MPRKLRIQKRHRRNNWFKLWFLVLESMAMNNPPLRVDEHDGHGGASRDVAVCVGEVIRVLFYGRGMLSAVLVGIQEHDPVDVCGLGRIGRLGV